MAQARAAAMERRKRVLVVDDEAAVRVLLRRVLERGGYVVQEAVDGQEALERIQATRPDLVVLDLMMPVMDGWEVLRRLAEGGDAPPVLILSALLDRTRAARSGAVACLQKPFGFDELLTTCAQILKV